LRLQAPKGPDVRPTTDRVREALFSIFGPAIQDARFLDLFAGTGANGIEALSRGAALAVFVDSERRAVDAIKANLDATGLAPNAHLLRATLPAGLDQVQGSFDFIFADPPYKFTAYERLLDELSQWRLVAEGGRVVLEHSRRLPLPEARGTLTRLQERHYGETALSVYA
jgi:16S rRNA (guanine(966)-N(2))-methyltransferase RsmD